MTEVDKESSNVKDNKTVKNVGLFLSEQLDGKGLYEGFVFLWRQWFDTDIVMKGYRSLFKFVLCCIRYSKV